MIANILLTAYKLERKNIKPAHWTPQPKLGTLRIRKRGIWRKPTPEEGSSWWHVQQPSERIKARRRLFLSSIWFNYYRYFTNTLSVGPITVSKCNTFRKKLDFLFAIATATASSEVGMEEKVGFYSSDWILPLRITNETIQLLEDVLVSQSPGAINPWKS